MQTVPESVSLRAATLSRVSPDAMFREIDTWLKRFPREAILANSIIKFKLHGTNGGEWWVDLRAPQAGQPIRCGVIEPLTGDSGPCESLTVEMVDFDFVDMVQGRQNFQLLFMTGRVKVTGDGAVLNRIPRAMGLVKWGDKV